MDVLSNFKKEYNQVRLEQLLRLYSIVENELDNISKWRMIIEIISRLN